MLSISSSSWNDVSGAISTSKRYSSPITSTSRLRTSSRTLSAVSTVGPGNDVLLPLMSDAIEADPAAGDEEALGVDLGRLVVLGPTLQTTPGRLRHGLLGRPQRGDPRVGVGGE